MKYCPKCGQIYAESYRHYERETCIEEGFFLREDPNMTEEQFLRLSEEEKDNYELHILDLCKQSGHFDEKYCERGKDNESYYYTFRFDKYEQLSGEKRCVKLSPEEQIEEDWRIKQSIREAVRSSSGSRDVPKCPTCQSTNIKKIGTLNRAVSVGIFGLASGKIGKTYKCSNCGATW